jgi:chemotaxis protein MotA
MDKKFDLSTLLGITLAILLLLAAMLSSASTPLSSFIDFPAILVVFGGTFCVTIASFSIADVIRTGSVCAQTLVYTNADRSGIVATCVRIAEWSKKEGILSIQRRRDLYENMGDFFNKYLALIIDGLGVHDVEKLLIQEITSIRERHRKAADVLRRGAEVSPAMGLVGTLIGLVQMLGNLNDPANIGPAMAIALLTTMYGAVVSYVFLTPLASKLEKNSKEEIEILKIYAEALVAIARQEGPMRLEMRMNMHLSPEDRIKIFS